MNQRPLLGGTDGFRDEATLSQIAGEMNPMTVFALSKALAELTGATAVVGADTRSCNTALVPAALAGLKAGGIEETIWLGTSPTPSTLRTALQLGASAAISMSASHNPAKDGGWKGTFGADKPYGKEVEALSDRAWKILDQGVPSTFYASEAMQQEHLRAYVQDIISEIESAFGPEPLAGTLFAIDTAHGAAKDVTPVVFELLGAEVERFACNDTRPINDGCGATDLSGIQDFIVQKGLYKRANFVGAIANDGDADRIIGVSVQVNKDGQPVFDTIDGNRLLEIMALKQPGVVGTWYTNDASVERIKSNGTRFEFCDNGDVEVTRKLRELGLTIGSEFSGHHVDLSWLTSGDGILKGAFLAAYAAKHNLTFDDITRHYPLYPEIMRKLFLPKERVGLKIAELGIDHILELSDEDHANHFRHVTRPSGTEPVVRVWGVGAHQDYVDHRTAQIAEAISAKIAA